jgi:hypothetical protein
LGIVYDSEKGELRIHGQRSAATDVREFCKQLDLLVGPTVARVQMHSIEALQGKNDVEIIRKEKPHATMKEIVDSLVEMDSASGFGVTRVSSGDNYSDPISIETLNPFVKAEVGAASACQTAWWCGAMSALLGRPLDVVNIVYDDERNVLRFQLVTRKGYDAGKV